MSDMLIRDIDPRLTRKIKDSARRSNRSLSDELKDLVRRGLETKLPAHNSIPPGKLGTYMFSLLEDEFRGDDLVFEVHDYPVPPDLE